MFQIPSLLNIYKPIGSTPFQVIERLKMEHPELRDVKMSFAGRLDPLAHGVLLILVGDTVTEREKLLALPKTYQCKVLLGVSTDSYDILGIVNCHSEQSEDISPAGPESLRESLVNDEGVIQGTLKTINSFMETDIPSVVRDPSVPQDDIIKFQIEKFLKSLKGKHCQFFPPFSSKPVKGKPLYWWAKQGRLDEIEIPSKEIEIYDAKLLEVASISKEQLRQEINCRVQKVSGHFRQAEVLESWDKFLSNSPMEFVLATIEISCSSGTYVRSIANAMGDHLGTGALAFEIYRIMIGEYSIETAEKLTLDP
jgi:tRNA pseudouridine55 synthase